MHLQDLLFSQGFGTRRVCAGLIQQGYVSIGQADLICTDALMDVAPDGLVYFVQGQAWTYQEKAYVLLHKPAGYECSRKPGAHPGVHTLLPNPLRMRSGEGVQSLGRLDHDTTGLLIMSDDGVFIHRLTSPKHHVPKVYEVTLKHDMPETARQRLLEGVVLDDDPQPVKAAGAELVDSRHLRLTLTQGKYHQVKRMVAAVGNRVEHLHRSAIGSLTLNEDDLKPGQWRWLSKEEVAALMKKSK